MVIAVLDEFTTPLFDVDNDGKPDFSHGETVSAQIKRRLPGATLRTFDIGKTKEIDIYQRVKDGKITTSEAMHPLVISNVNTILKGLAVGHQEGDRLDAINMSFGAPIDVERTTFKNFSEITGIPVTTETLGKRRADLKKKLTELAGLPEKTATPRQRYYGAFKQPIETLETITRQKVPVYVAAGNSPDEVNPYGLADGVTLVGATDRRGNPWKDTARNKLITRFAQGVYQAKPVAKGYDITGDGVADYTAKDLSAKGSRWNTFLNMIFDYPEIAGTSLAAPTALAEDLARKK